MSRALGNPVSLVRQEGLYRTVFYGLSGVVNGDADPTIDEQIVVNATCQRPGVCNAMETLLVDAKTQELLTGVLPLSDIKAATVEDWYTEYIDLILSVRVVNGVVEAIEDITKYGSAHSDAIVTRTRWVSTT